MNIKNKFISINFIAPNYAKDFIAETFYNYFSVEKFEYDNNHDITILCLKKNKKYKVQIFYSNFEENEVIFNCNLIDIKRIIIKVYSSHLITLGFSFYHSSGYTHDNNVYLIFGDKNVGKTTKLLQIIQNINIDYFCNDICALRYNHGNFDVISFPNCISVRKPTFTLVKNGSIYLRYTTTNKKNDRYKLSLTCFEELGIQIYSYGLLGKIHVLNNHRFILEKSEKISNLLENKFYQVSGIHGEKISKIEKKNHEFNCRFLYAFL